MFSKHAWVVSIKDKKGVSIVNAFKKIISEGSEAESKRENNPNKIWVDQGSEFYNNSFKDFLKTNNIELYSTHNKENLLLLRDLLERWETKFLNIWLLFKKMLILMC